MRSVRESKFEALMQEAKHYGVDEDTVGLIHVIANELSWREIMRVIHKLRRKRGVEE